MLASLPELEENKEEGQEGRMVTLVVSIDEELLRRIETSVHPDFVTERTAYAEVGEAIEPGELAISKFRPNGSLET